MSKNTIPSSRISGFGLGDKIHELIREIACREIDPVFDSIDELKKGLFDSIDELKQRLIDLEEFTGAYNDNEFEDARTGDQIKADIKKRRQNEKS